MRATNTAHLWLFLPIVLTAGTLAAMQTTPDPDTQGKKVIESQCGSCHTVERATAVNQDREKWKATVRKMADYGAPISEPEIVLAVEYLAKHFGPRAEEDPAKAELDRTARKHIEGICSTCHLATLISETRAAREEWFDIVKKMNSKGAGLSDVDVELLTDYLARNYPKKP